jgi:hypothetical protein
MIEVFNTHYKVSLGAKKGSLYFVPLSLSS